MASPSAFDPGPRVILAVSAKREDMLKLALADYLEWVGLQDEVECRSACKSTPVSENGHAAVRTGSLS